MGNLMGLLWRDGGGPTGFNYTINFEGDVETRTEKGPYSFIEQSEIHSGTRNELMQDTVSTCARVPANGCGRTVLL